MLVETFIFELWNMSDSVKKHRQFVSDKAGRLELNHLSLPLLLSSQLKVFGSLDGMLKLKFISFQIPPFSLLVTWFFHLHSVHSSLSTSFLVVLAFFLKMGLDWPPKPCCLRSYLVGWNSQWWGLLRYCIEHTFSFPGPALTRRTSYTESPWRACETSTLGGGSRSYGAWERSPYWSSESVRVD